MIGVIARAGDHGIVAEFFELFKTPWELWRADRHYDVVICADEAARPDAGRGLDVAKLVFVYGSGRTAVDDATNIRIGRERRQLTISWNGDRIPIYGACLTFPSDDGSLPLAVEETGESVVAAFRAHRTTIVRVGYDLFDEIRFLLTAGQPSSYAELPTLERHIAFLRDAIVAAGVSLIEIPPIPQGHRFIACLTHDVDHPSIRFHRFDHTVLGFLYRATIGSLLNVCRGRVRAATLWRNLAAVARLPLVHAGLADDFWSDFGRYLAIEKGLGSTFFVIPFARQPGRMEEGDAPRSRASAYGVRDISPQVTALVASGCEIALHGIDAWLDTSTGVKERRRISSVTGASTTGVRMHWLYFDLRAPQRLEAAGFAYDSTFGYNDTVGFRAGTLQAFRPPSATRLLELPLAVMDTALFYPSRRNLTQEAARHEVWPILDAAERHGGALTINWHDRSLAPERLWDAFYVELVEELKRRNAWCPTAAQAAAWFSRRRSAVFERTHASSGAGVRVGAASDSALPGLMIRVHTPAGFTDVPLDAAPDATAAAGAA
jgi:hypothetical protein